MNAALRVYLCLLPVVLAFGCGPSGPVRYGVEGSVSYKAQPLKVGQISFLPEGATASAGGAPINDGKFSVPAQRGLFPGKYKVSISSTSSGDVKTPEMPGVSDKQTKETLPARYNAKTELTAEIPAGGKHDLNFDLK